MIQLTTEEAIKELSRYTNQEFYTPQNREAHRMAIEALEGSRWIPVEERLPEENGRYLCCVKSYAFPGYSYWNILRYDKDGFHESGIYEDGVTHWMPLPEPPGKDGAV